MKKFLAVFLLLLTPFFVVFPVLAKETGEHIVVGQDEVIDKDFFAAGEAVTVLGTINGDAYIAGGNVTIDGVINGDLLVAGGNVTIRGTVTDDIRVAGGTVIIASDVGKNVTAAGGNLTLASDTNVAGSVVLAGGNVALHAPVGRGATLAGGQIDIGNFVGGDVWAGVGMLTVGPQANVSGNLHYISDQEAVITSGAVIAGQTTMESPPRPSEEEQKAAEATFKGLGLGFKLASLLSSIIIGLIFVKLFPRFMESTAEVIRKSPWKSLGVGIITYIVSPIVFLILLVTLIGIPLSLILLFGIIIIACIAKVFTVFFVGNWILRTLNWKGGNYVSLLVGFLVYLLLSFIPVISALSWCVFLLVGTGALLLTKKRVYTELRQKNSI